MASFQIIGPNWISSCKNAQQAHDAGTDSQDQSGDTILKQGAAVSLHNLQNALV